MSHSTPDNFQTTQFVYVWQDRRFDYLRHFENLLFVIPIIIYSIIEPLLLILFCSLITDIALSAFLWPGGDKRLL